MRNQTREMMNSGRQLVGTTDRGPTSNTTWEAAGRLCRGFLQVLLEDFRRQRQNGLPSGVTFSRMRAERVLWR